MIDFLQSLEIDVVLKILMCLDDPADLIRVSAASQYSRNLVISNGLCKQLCMRTFPQLGCITHVTEPTDSNTFHKEHKAYGSLFQAITSFQERICPIYPVSASSTDHYPRESIINTIDPREQMAFYWSSKGHEDPEMKETLIYNLSSNFCVITEIDIKPFQEWVDDGILIYSARFVRFRMGHPKSFNDIKRNFIKSKESADDKFLWTYTSQIFAMVQESRLQKFKLPEPVLCIGGYLQIELMGGIVKHPYDDNHYICVAYVQAIGRQLSPAFSVNFSEPSKTFSLNYNSQEFKRRSELVDNLLKN